jgi:hypothetical protein
VTITGSSAQPRASDLTDFEWSVIEPLLPMDRPGPKPKDNRKVLNGIQPEEVPLEKSHLLRAQSRRALLQQAEAIPAYRYPLRQARRDFLRFRLARLRANLAHIN